MRAVTLLNRYLCRLQRTKQFETNQFRMSGEEVAKAFTAHYYAMRESGDAGQLTGLFVSTWSKLHDQCYYLYLLLLLVFTFLMINYPKMIDQPLVVLAY